MQVSHIETINKYEKLGSQAREMASRNLPRHLLGKIALEAIDHKALAAFKSIDFCSRAFSELGLEFFEPLQNFLSEGI